MEDEKRIEWIKSHRAWRLQVDFARDLHVRLFNSFARLGFDDHGWYADADLAIMVTEGQKQLHEAEVSLDEAQQAVQQKEAKSEPVPGDMRKNIERRRADVEAARKELQPYLDEQQRREKVI
jgi:hypothetical protein